LAAFEEAVKNFEPMEVKEGAKDWEAGAPGWMEGRAEFEWKKYKERPVATIIITSFWQKPKEVAATSSSSSSSSSGGGGVGDEAGSSAGGGGGGGSE
jgi:hypothetical protein